MTCIGTVRRALVRLGLYPNFTDVEAKEAETENLVHDRGKVLNELAVHAANFKQSSEAVEATTEARKDDLAELLDHIKNINKASSTAQTILARMISKGRPPFPLL